jgi:hypothetical protein
MCCLVIKKLATRVLFYLLSRCCGCDNFTPVINPPMKLNRAGIATISNIVSEPIVCILLASSIAVLKNPLTRLASFALPSQEEYTINESMKR